MGLQANWGAWGCRVPPGCRAARLARVESDGEGSVLALVDRDRDIAPARIAVDRRADAEAHVARLDRFELGPAHGQAHLG
jgi:hypothetical protein